MNKINRKHRFFKFYSWAYFSLGLISLGLGIYFYFFREAVVAVNIKTQQPLMANGTNYLVLGLGFFLIGIYRILRSDKVYKTELEIENVYENQTDENILKGFGFSKKKIRILMKQKNQKHHDYSDK